MNLMVSRGFALFLALLLAVPPSTALAAFSEAYQEGLERYTQGDYRGAVAVLEEAPSDDPTDALLLGLAQLRLEDPVRAADAWADFIRTSPDAALASEVARLRTIVVREANRRAARSALASENNGGTSVSEDVLAVLPFRNVGEAEYEPLGKAIAAMLADSLAAVPTSRVVGRGRVEAFLDAADDGSSGDTKVARRVGLLLGAGMVVVGAHVDTSSDPMTLEVDSAVIDTSTGQRLESGSFLAPLDRFYVSVRDTSAALSNRLGWPVSALPAASAARVQAVHTESLDAALAFGRGLDLEDRGDLDGARREYERAVRADPSFRLARLQLATLPAALMSMPAVAAAVQSELAEVEPPTAVAGAPAVVVPVVVAPATTTDSATTVATTTTGAPTKAAPKAATTKTTAASVEQAEGETGDEEETTILGMSPMTAALVGGGLAIAIGGAAAAAGGGGGGGGDSGGGGNVPPLTLTGVNDTEVSAGGLIVLNVVGDGGPDQAIITLTDSGAPSAATFDTSSGRPATGTFRWQTTASDGGQTVNVTFTATASGGPAVDPVDRTARLVVDPVLPTPTPPPACGGTGASCTDQAECCQDIPRECEVTPAGGGTTCCLGFTTSCTVDGDCCGSDNACQGQQCCAPLGIACGGAADCCADGATCDAGSCCLPEGLSCANDSDCCTGRCASGVCEGIAPPTPTPAPTSTPPACVPQGGPCDAVFECCLGSDCDQTPTSLESLCCAPIGEQCSDDSICCGADTGCEEVCCKPLQSACENASECCGGGAGCVLGRCCSAPGGNCSFDRDCCAGSCLGGSCSAALSAEASPRPSPAPTPRPPATPAPTSTSDPSF